MREKAMNRPCTKVMTTLKFYNNESNLSMERIVPFCARNFMECVQKTTMNNRVHL